jgi:hypothetical protein
MLKILFILYALGIGWFLYKLLPEPTNQDDENLSQTKSTKRFSMG